MEQVKLTIDGISVEVEEGSTILEAAQRAGIYIPRLCYHPDLPPFDSISPSSIVYQCSTRIEGSSETFQGCQLCLVEVEGKGIMTSCNTEAKDGMIVYTDMPEVLERRQENLSRILGNHPHSCLTCPQREGCDLLQCSMNVPESERCCWKFNFCELRKVAEYIGIRVDTPRYIPQNLPVVEEEPLFKVDYNLCIGCTRCVRVCQEIRGVGALGYTMADGKAKVGFLGPSAEEAGCKFCGACVEVCPTGALGDKDIRWAERETALVPCKNACPAGVDVPRYANLVSQGRFAEAVAVIREKVPFPTILGHVCTHPCEDVCRRGELNEAINIRELKRIAAEHDANLWRERFKLAPKTGKKVAIVGSGPAGLTCGYYLSKLGHSITIFELLPEPGGMLRFGIPGYRLPREILDREIEEIKGIGVQIETNTEVRSLDGIFEQGYEAIFLAVGALEGLKMGIEGEDSPGVMDGLSFLKNVNLGKDVKIGEKVAVVGGGNVAIDSARSALRLGAKDVTILYRRSRDEMPAIAEEVEEAIDEGVNINFLVAPNKISTLNGKLNLECLRMELGEPDSSGRRRPVPISGSEFNLEFDNIIEAVGEKPEIPGDFKLSLGQDDALEVDPNTLSTLRKGVFAGGDVVSGPSSVIEAVATGRKAAQAMDQFLGGKEDIEERLVQLEKPDPYLGKEEGFAGWERVTETKLPAKERLHGFEAVIRGYTKEQAIQEAKRCLRCDLRFDISQPILPPEKWIEFKPERVRDVPEKEGVFQLFDADKHVLYIKGTENLRREMEGELGYEKAKYFVYEEEPMYTSRESELLQQFLRQHGQLPERNGVEEELF